MGAMTPIISGISTFVDAANTINSAFNMGSQWAGVDARDTRRQQELALKHLRSSQELKQAETISAARTAQQTMQAEAQESERKRLAALRRSVARQKAAFGGQGLIQDGGSSEAVLLGMISESDAERAAREQIDSIRHNALSQSVEQQQQRNLLELTQLAEKQAINRLSRFG